MNKIIVGSLLVAVMGGVPGATYLLTQEKEVTNKPVAEDTQTVTPESAQKRQEPNDQLEKTCNTSENEDTCPGQTKNPSG